MSEASPPGSPEDISATLAEGRWALLSGDDVVGVETRDPAGRFPDALDILDARDVPDVAPGWRRADGRLAPPEPPAAPTPSRVVSGVVFLDLFTDAELDGLWAASPKLKRGAMRVMSQDSANLDSPDLAGLLRLAVAKGVLTRARADRIAAGLPPEADDASPTPAAAETPSPTDPTTPASSETGQTAS